MKTDWQVLAPLTVIRFCLFVWIACFHSSCATVPFVGPRGVRSGDVELEKLVVETVLLKNTTGNLTAFLDLDQFTIQELSKVDSLKPRSLKSFDDLRTGRRGQFIDRVSGGRGVLLVIKDVFVGDEFRKRWAGTREESADAAAIAVQYWSASDYVGGVIFLKRSTNNWSLHSSTFIVN